MNPRRPHSNRPGGRRGGFASGGGGRGFGGGRRGGGGGGGRQPDLPMLLGEPSPSLAKINTMNMAKLQEKIDSLHEEQQRMQAKLDRLVTRDPQPTEKVEQAQATLARLKALEEAAAQRLAGKQERKAIRDRQGR